MYKPYTYFKTLYHVIQGGCLYEEISEDFCKPPQLKLGFSFDDDVDPTSEEAATSCEAEGLEEPTPPKDWKHECGADEEEAERLRVFKVKNSDRMD